MIPSRRDNTILPLMLINACVEDGFLKYGENSSGENYSSAITVDLKTAAQWLEAVNNLTLENTDQEQKVYAYGMMDGMTLWACVQFEIYEELKYLTGIREFVAYLLKLDGDYRIDGCSADATLQNVLNSLGFKTAPEKRSVSLKKETIESANRLYWNVCNFLRDMKAFFERRSVLVYTPDIVSEAGLGCDFRFSPVYRWLKETGTPFTEIVKPLWFGKSLGNMIRRKRLPVYLVYSAMNSDSGKGAVHSGTTEDPVLSRWIRFRLSYYIGKINVYRKSVMSLRRRLRKITPRLLVGMDDFRGHSQVLLMACRLEKITSILIQHGLLTRYHAGWVCPGIPQHLLPVPDRFLVHSQFWQDRLETIGSPLAPVSSVVDGWETINNISSGLPRKKIVSGEETHVLLLYETMWPSMHEIREFVVRLAAHKDVKIHFKTRPDQSQDDQVALYFSGDDRPYRVVNRLDKEVLSKIHFIVGSHSSLLYNFAVSEIPIVRIVTSYVYGDNLSESGITIDWAGEMTVDQLFMAVNAVTDEQLTEAAGMFRNRRSVPQYSTVLNESLGRSSVGI